MLAERNALLGWLVVLLAAIAIDQLTGDAIFAAALPCVRAGSKSFRCGCWLLRADPLAPRARACFGFYLAAACWKAAACALATIAMLMVIDGLLGRMPPLAEGIVELIVLFGGLCLSTTIGIVAAVVSLRSRVRVWVHPNVRNFCNGDFAHLAHYGNGYPVFNQAIFVLATSFVFPSVIGAAIVLAWATADVQANAPATPANVLLVLLVMFGGPLATLPLYTWFSRRIIARTPAECWPPPAICPNFERDYSQRR